MISPEFKREEYWLIKWPLLALVLSLIVSGGLFAGINALDATAATELRRARSALDEAREAVDKIEEEEATIIEYVGRYREMEQRGVVTPENRLQFQERLQDIRDENDLSDVDYTIGVQSQLPLEYSGGRSERGRQILLNTSLVEFDLPLLHEDDLSRLLAALMEGPGVVQPLSCSLTTNSNRTSFIYLAHHFDAACRLNWYTFQLPPPPRAADAEDAGE